MARKLFCAGKSNDFPNQEVTRTWSVKWYDCFVCVMVILLPSPDLNFRWHELSPANGSLSMLSCAGHEMLVRQCCPLGSGCLCLRTASSMKKTDFLSSSSLRLCPDLDKCLLSELGRTLVVFICKYSLPSLEALWHDCHILCCILSCFLDLKGYSVILCLFQTFPCCFKPFFNFSQAKVLPLFFIYEHINSEAHKY